MLSKMDLQKKWTFRKGGLRTFTKFAKIHCIGQKQLYDKFEFADFKYDNNFSSKLQPKTPKQAFLVPKLRIFSFAQIFVFLLI